MSEFAAQFGKNKNIFIANVLRPVLFAHHLQRTADAQDFFFQKMPDDQPNLFRIPRQFLQFPLSGKVRTHFRRQQIQPRLNLDEFRLIQNHLGRFLKKNNPAFQFE